MSPFGIAPVLDHGWRLDPYERYLIAQIRNGKYCSALWDSNSLFLGGGKVYAEPLVTAALVITPAIMEMHRKDLAERKAAWAAAAPERAAKAAAKAEAKAKANEEYRRIQAEWEARRARKAAEAAERKAEWEAAEAREAEIEAERARQAEEVLSRRIPEIREIEVLGAATRQLTQRVAERQAILNAPWQCVKCLKRATIEVHLGDFRLVCEPCGESRFAPHSTLARIVGEAQAA